MTKRDDAREEAAFLRGDIGADGLAVEVEEDETEVEKGKASEQLMRGRTYLGREFLTWLLFKSEGAGTLIEHGGEAVSVLFAGRILLRGIAGDATEVIAKGAMSPYSEVVRHAIDRGLLVHAAHLRIQRGEQSFEVGLDAEFLDFRSAKLPAVLSKEEDDKISERLYLAEQLSEIIEALLRDFLAVRATKKWRAKIVPEIKEWLARDRK